MKVKELISQLRTLDQEAEVLMQRDDEGNGYRTLNGVDEDECCTVDYDDYIFLSHYTSLEEVQNDYEGSLDFFSVCVLY